MSKHEHHGDYAGKVRRDTAVQESHEALPGRDKTIRVSPHDRRGPKFGIPGCVGNDCAELHKSIVGK